MKTWLVKTFLAVVGAIFLVAILLVGGTGLYIYKKAGAGLGVVSAAEIEKFLRTHHPSPHVVELLKRVENDVKLAKSLQQSTLAMAALSVLSRPDAVSLSQELMLEEAATLLEKPDLSFADIKRFQDKHRELLPKKSWKQRRHSSDESMAVDPNQGLSFGRQMELSIDAYKRRHQVEQKSSELLTKLYMASLSAQKNKKTDYVAAAVTMALFHPGPLTPEQQHILDQAATLLSDPNLTTEQSLDLVKQAMAARHDDDSHRHLENALPNHP